MKAKIKATLVLSAKDASRISSLMHNGIAKTEDEKFVAEYDEHNNRINDAYAVIDGTAETKYKQTK